MSIVIDTESSICKVMVALTTLGRQDLIEGGETHPGPSARKRPVWSKSGTGAAL